MADQKQVHPSLKYTCCHDCCMSLWRWDLILSNCVRLFYMHWAFQHINEGQWKRCLIIDRSLVCEQKTLTEIRRQWACAPFKTQLRMSVKFDSVLDFKFSQQTECHLIFWIGIQRIVKSCHRVLTFVSFSTIWISLFCGTQTTIWRLCCMQLQWMSTEAFKLQKGHKSRIKIVHSKSSDAIQ